MAEHREKLILELAGILEQSEIYFLRITNDLTSTFCGNRLYSDRCGGYHSPTILTDKAEEICKQIKVIDNDLRICHIIDKWIDKYICDFNDLETFCSFLNAYGIHYLDKDKCLHDLTSDLNNYRNEIKCLLTQIVE